METDVRIEALEHEINAIKQQIKSLLIDVRIYLLEAQSPIKVTNEANADGGNADETVADVSSTK